MERPENLSYEDYRILGKQNGPVIVSRLPCETGRPMSSLEGPLLAEMQDR